MIVSSSYTEDAHAQKDGRRFVTETHTDSAGAVHQVSYKASPGMDLQAIMAARAVALSEQLAEGEVDGALENWQGVAQQTKAQFADRLRRRFKNAEGAECARIARWILARIVAGDFTDAQLRTAFGLTVTQWNNLKARLQTLVAHHDAVIAARGE